MLRSGSTQRRVLRLTCALAAVLLGGLSPAQARTDAAAPTVAAAASPTPATPQQGSDSVASRVGRLEGQIADLQVMIGTLELLLREKPGATLQHETPSSPAADGNLAQRSRPRSAPSRTSSSPRSRRGLLMRLKPRRRRKTNPTTCRLVSGRDLRRSPPGRPHRQSPNKKIRARAGTVRRLARARARGALHPVLGHRKAPRRFRPAMRGRFTGRLMATSSKTIGPRKPLAGSSSRSIRTTRSRATRDTGLARRRRRRPCATRPRANAARPAADMQALPISPRRG